MDKELDGVPILEVYEIRYIGHSPVKPENQIGWITIGAGSSSYDLYDQTKVDMSKPLLEYGDKLRLNDVGPICPFYDLEMHFDLFRRACSGYVIEDSESLGMYDSLIKTYIPSLDGCYKAVSVLSGYFHLATVANLEVVLSYIDDTANVYGVVAATNTKFDHPSSTSMLFFKESSNTIKVGHDGVIPLSKARVGVPLDSKLIVDICLFCDGEPYKGTAYFTPGIENQCSEQVVDGWINVRVTWNWKCNEDSETSDDDFDYTSGSDSDSDSQSSEDLEENTENET